jgi:cytoplasmic iron level regulating protein YaaA (DUF328/UPF0246 family)
MLILISPSKTSELHPIPPVNYTQPRFIKDASFLMDVLKSKSQDDIQKMMHLSDKLTIQTHQWIQNLKSHPKYPDARCAVFHYKGEVYVGLNALAWDDQDIQFAQNNLRILSALYGILRPLDLVQLYRLEMGAKIQIPEARSLYAFWSDKITDSIKKDLQLTNGRMIVNLASDEYYKCIKSKSLNVPVVQVEFYERRKGKAVFISFSAKKARGLMAHYIIKNRVEDITALLEFNYEGYVYEKSISTMEKLVFVKESTSG